MTELGELTAAQRAEAMSRYAVLEPHLNGSVPLARVGGLVALARTTRTSPGPHLDPDLALLIQGLALRKNPPSIVTIARTVNVAVAAAGDNAARESFFSLLQKNSLNRRPWRTRDDLGIAIATRIGRNYHRRRRQDGLGRVAPSNTRPS